MVLGHSMVVFHLSQLSRMLSTSTEIQNQEPRLWRAHDCKKGIGRLSESRDSEPCAVKERRKKADPGENAAGKQGVELTFTQTAY